MARYGEGDPRWIVEERPDALNVNNWHWYESSFYKTFIMVFVLFFFSLVYNKNNNRGS